MRIIRSLQRSNFILSCGLQLATGSMQYTMKLNTLSGLRVLYIVFIPYIYGAEVDFP